MNDERVITVRQLRGLLRELERAKFVGRESDEWVDGYQEAVLLMTCACDNAAAGQGLDVLDASAQGATVH